MDQNKYLKNLIIQCAEAGEDTIAFSLYDGQQVTNISYPQFAKDVLDAAGYFMERNIRGQHIALLAPNSYQWIVILFAIIGSRNIAVLMNPNLPADMLHQQFQKAEVSLVCSNSSEITEKIGTIPVIWFDQVHGETTPSMDSLFSDDDDKISLMLFTSGTTGNSKAVMLSPRNFFANAQSMNSDTEWPGAEMLLLPLYHAASIKKLIIKLCTLRTVVLGRGIKYMFIDMPHLNPTHMVMVPAMVESLGKIMRRTPPEKLPNYIGNSFRYIAVTGAALKSGIAKFLLNQGFQLCCAFGMTETAGDGSWCMMDEAHIGSIGKPGKNISFRIDDGEILIKSDGVMKGYYKDQKETAKVIVDGWLHTGDMGYCDKDGYYYITGRKKNVIILSNGENVNPEEIEANFGNCESIEECMVYSDKKGICADVFSHDKDAAAAYIKDYNESMPMYRQVYKVNYTTEPLPKTSSGKIKRKENL